MMNVRIVRLMGWFGIIAPFIAALMMYVSAGSTPGWSLTEQTMAGSVMLLFGAGLYEFSDGDTVGRIGTALYLLSSGIVIGLSLATIEIQPIHDLAAITLFVALPLSAAVTSVYAWRIGLKPYAVIGFAAAAISVGVWAVAGSVTALYELMALAPIGLWLMALGYWMCRQVPDDDL